MLNILTIALLFSRIHAQQTDHDLYVSLYQKGDYDKAVTVLKRLTKQNVSDGDAWYYLGLTYLKIEKEKDAVKALEKADVLKPKEAEVHNGLAYAYLLRNDKRANDEANQALKLNPNIAEAHYVVGIFRLRNGTLNAAYERAKKAIELNPKFTAAYLLKAQSLISSFAQQSGTVMRQPGNRGEMLREAANDLEKYIALSSKNKDLEFYQSYFESIKFFAEYYERPENVKPISVDQSSPDEPGKIPLKLIYKPKPSYTDSARSNNISGTVRLLVGFSADGNIKHILILKSLDAGLDRNAIEAARQIKFQPQQINGTSVSTVRTIEYSFAVY